MYDIRITGRTTDDELLYEAGYVNFYLGAGGFGETRGPGVSGLNRRKARAPISV